MDFNLVGMHIISFKRFYNNNALWLLTQEMDYLKKGIRACYSCRSCVHLTDFQSAVRSHIR